MVTYSGTEMLTQHPDSAYAPANVWGNGYLIPIRSRARCTLAERWVSATKSSPTSVPLTPRAPSLPSILCGRYDCTG
ncbi:hypothetical protein SGFS_006730 [Streptomyces graminofaciens]|uniref:Uncharacterized protein n=1 Tax=Streptomyces graminofaciens TaxID=68212 RepID=A0ABM7F0Z3_9ACTN|nr:hypothetical protein SGFS_006730 [Streptomyces graminofaciens]